MKRVILTGILLALAVVVWSCAASDPQAQKLSRGKYLVENVGMCSDCHTRRNDKGELDKTHWLQGSELEMMPTALMPWANAAPMIAGLPSLNEKDAVNFLETGALPGGRQLRPPMPAFRFSHEDAEAVVTYLKSLNTKRG